ncbi:unnamed protein product [Urochloa humidicola]
MESLLVCLLNCYKWRATRRRMYIVVNGPIKGFQKHSQCMPDSSEDNSSNLKKKLGYLSCLVNCTSVINTYIDLVTSSSKDICLEINSRRISLVAELQWCNHPSNP